MEMISTKRLGKHQEKQMTLFATMLGLGGAGHLGPHLHCL